MHDEDLGQPFDPALVTKESSWCGATDMLLALSSDKKRNLNSGSPSVKRMKLSNNKSSFANLGRRMPRSSDMSTDDITALAISSASTVASSGNSSDASSDTGCKAQGDFKSEIKVLPVWKRQQEIVDSVRTNQVTVIVGEPGSGKTTQIPQMLLKLYGTDEHQKRPSVIAITQPRRVAAITLATRVLAELKEKSSAESAAHYTIGGLVGYSVRFQHKASKSTRIKFLTDGCLLREAITDPMLRRYQVIIIDEAHERTVRTDILLGLLKLLLQRRPKLRLIIMSATLDFRAFTTFFGQGNVVVVPGRQHPVRLHYAIRTCEDYLEGVVSTVLQLHLSNRSSGDILAFLSGEDEIESARALLEERLRTLHQIRLDFVATATTLERLRQFRSSEAWKAFLSGIWERDGSCADSTELPVELKTFLGELSPTQLHLAAAVRKRLEAWMGSQHTGSQQANVIRAHHLSRVSLEADCSPDAESVMTLFSSDVKPERPWDMIVLPLYAALPMEQQRRVFSPAPQGTRKVILATNIAETSLTLPGVKFVVDSGVHKVKTYNPLSGVDSLIVQPISRAMANQRMGRAGREGPGEAFRLYTDEEYFNMDVQAEPEIKRTNLTQVILELKAIGVNDVKKFPFLSPPSMTSIDKALDLLIRIGALDGERQLTALGKKLSALPIAPEFAKFLLDSVDFGCTSEALTIVAILNSDPIWVGDSFVQRKIDGEAPATVRSLARKKVLCVHGDHLTLVNAFAMWEATLHDKLGFCKAVGLNHKSLMKAKRIRDQLKDILLSPAVGLSSISSCLALQEDTNGGVADAIRQCLVKSFPWSIAATSTTDETTPRHKGDDTTYTTAAYVIESSRTPVSIHPSSGLFGRTPKPRFVVFSELVQTSKLYMRLVTEIDGEWLPRLHPTLFIRNAGPQKQCSFPAVPSSRANKHHAGSGTAERSHKVDVRGLLTAKFRGVSSR